MELEFDKEIDAILRKARGGETAAAAVVSPHADADTIAAFAENVLPQKAKLLYIEHFADCDRCRQMLSQSVLLNNEAVATTASPSIPAPVSETVLPWYKKLFKTQNLALAMGGLVLAFSGLLGYLVLQRQSALSDMTVSQTANKEERVPGGPYLGEDADAQVSESANTAATAPANAAPANTSANMAAVAATPSSNMSPVTFAETERGLRSALPSDTIAGADRDKAKPEAAAPPPAPFTIDGVTRESDEKKLDDKRKELPKDLELAKRRADEMRSRDLPASKGVGPSRSGTGPLQNQSNQTNSNIFDMSVTRNVGGKSFKNNERVWYDSTYRGQATINIRRGTDEFKKLDDGLRNIANSLSGTVVVVWKGKAYRIQ